MQKQLTAIIRIKPEERNLIDRAARLRGKNRTDFILDAVRLAAEEALYDQAIIAADPEAYAKFLARLDMQPYPGDGLRKTMQTPVPWEKA
ncbi:MAG: DUF1778 domain-containing protein [Desulfobacteraceae bacterium]|jgi:uncharacterized protein (DUF1778 family)|nr:DUF1778 domain-containing protein [Desulfobacteraceae bacterium]